MTIVKAEDLVGTEGNGRFYYDALNPDSCDSLEEVQYYTALFQVPFQVYDSIKNLTDFRLLILCALEVDYNTTITLTAQWRKNTITKLSIDAPRLSRSLAKLKELGFIDISGNVCKLNPYLFNRGKPTSRSQTIALLKQMTK